MQVNGTMIDRLGAGTLFGDYEVMSVAGTGGMGVVYKATQRTLDRVVALKVIQDEIARTPEYNDRFLREARLAASVNHPHVVSVYDVGDEDDKLFLAMQWIDGDDLKKTIQRSGRLAPDRAVVIAAQIAGAIDAVHSVAGLIHRDVKPANVLLGQIGGHDHAYLTDFGVAKPSGAAEHLTQTGWVVGTPGYLSPEQIRGQEPGPRSDLYALGCLSFEMLTGIAPFAGENDMALRWAHANDPRPAVSTVLPVLGRGYDEFFSAALAVDPAHRFGSGREFAAALTAAHAGQLVTAALPVVQTHAPTAVGPHTPLQPSQTPPLGVPAYAAYGYLTPPPAHPHGHRSGSPLALVMLGLIALAGIGVGALAAAGVFSKASPTTQTITTGVVSHPTVTPTKVVAHKHVTRPRARPSAPASGSTACGANLSVGPNTSCAFAQNVEQAYAQSSGGKTDVSAFSPATGLTYTMHCTAGVLHACTGGKNASVYFTSGSTSTPTPTPSSSGSMTACDQNISAGPGTSCPFAANVFVAYFHDYQANGMQSSNSITASSPVTNQSYAMSCTNDGITVNCAGGNNAFVTFPYRAVQVY